MPEYGNIQTDPDRFERMVDIYGLSFGDLVWVQGPKDHEFYAGRVTETSAQWIRVAFDWMDAFKDGDMAFHRSSGRPHNWHQRRSQGRAKEPTFQLVEIKLPRPTTSWTFHT
jgi:hypothetical protein